MNDTQILDAIEASLDAMRNGDIDAVEFADIVSEVMNNYGEVDINDFR